jgi:hypothetical protein
MLRSSWFLGLSAAGFLPAAVACSSDTSAGSDSGGDVTAEASGSSGGGSGSSSSSGGAGSSSGSGATCDASVVIPEAGTDGAPPLVCIQCMTSNCASQITACGTDCACVASLNCLFTMDQIGFNNAYSARCQSTALGQISAGNAALIAWNGCTAQNCNCPCFGQCTDGGATRD